MAIGALENSSACRQRIKMRSLADFIAITPQHTRLEIIGDEEQHILNFSVSSLAKRKNCSRKQEKET